MKTMCAERAMFLACMVIAMGLAIMMHGCWRPTFKIELHYTADGKPDIVWDMGVGDGENENEAER